MPAAEPHADASLRRELGRWDLTAIGVNQVIGSAIFLVPSLIAASLGAWSPLAFVLAGGASMLVALCFAEVGSRFDRTGGPYLYSRAAFGRFAGFEVGWMQWVTRVTSQASVTNGAAMALGAYWPAASRGAGRAAVITVMIGGLAAINARGIRPSKWVVNTLTVGKLLPLAVFIGVGFFFVDWSRLGGFAPVTGEAAASAALLLIFTFGGYDVIPVPAGEAREPRRHVPFAFVTTIAIITIIMTLAQIVTMGTLPGVAGSKTPMADAAALFLGAAGALVITIGSVLSMAGNTAGSLLSCSRILFAMGAGGELPRFFARVHSRFRTPVNAVAFTAVIAITLALSGSFAMLAAVSAVARLVIYTGTCAATLRLRYAPGGAGEAQFTAPLGPVVPAAGILISLGILASASRDQLAAGGAALLAGALLFMIAGRGGRRGHGEEINTETLRHGDSTEQPS